MRITSNKYYEVNLTEQELYTIEYCLNYTRHRKTEHGKCKHVSLDIIENMRNSLKQHKTN